VAYSNLIANLEQVGTRLCDVALVFQWNKRDVPRALPVARLEKQLNPQGAPAAEAIAWKGIGVRETERLLMMSTFRLLRSQLQEQEAPA
jgi:hypothetical protein